MSDHKTLSDWPRELRERFGIAPLTSERAAYIDVMCGIAEDFSDGAFFGFMEEKGIDSTELVAWNMHENEDYPFLDAEESDG